MTGKRLEYLVMEAGFPLRAIQGALDGSRWGSYTVAFYETVISG